MIVVVLWGSLDWVVDIAETAGSIAAILLAGAVLAVVAFRLLYRAIRRLGGQEVDWPEVGADEEPDEPIV